MRTGATPKRAGFSPLLLAVSLIVGVPWPGQAVDLAGHWRVEVPAGAPSPFVDVVQAGDDVTIEVAPGLTVSGTISAPGDFTLSGAGTQYQGRLLAGGTIMHGRAISPPPSPAVAGFMLSRCECFDGNTTDGDGCDAACRVEPCFTCSGDPSSCTPSPDAAACDDRLDCTTGETCSAGVCGGAAAVPTCVDLSGRWQLRSEVDVLPGDIFEHEESVTQRDGLVRFLAGTAVIRVSTIDTSAGAFLPGQRARSRSRRRARSPSRSQRTASSAR